MEIEASEQNGETRSEHSTIEQLTQFLALASTAESRHLLQNEDHCIQIGAQGVMFWHEAFHSTNYKNNNDDTSIKLQRDFLLAAFPIRNHEINNIAMLYNGLSHKEEFADALLSSSWGKHTARRVGRWLQGDIAVFLPPALTGEILKNIELSRSDPLFVKESGENDKPKLIDQEP